MSGVKGVGSAGALGASSGVSGAGSGELVHGGVRGPSSSSAASPRSTFVPPPSMFSPTYEVITTDEASMMPRSSVFPKSPKWLSKAPLNKLEPMALPSTRPFSAAYSKSAS